MKLIDRATGQEQSHEPIIALGFQEIVENVAMWLERKQEVLSYTLENGPGYKAVILKKHGDDPAERTPASYQERHAKLIRFDDGTWRVRFSIWRFDDAVPEDEQQQLVHLLDLLDLYYGTTPRYGQTPVQRAYMDVVNHLFCALRFDDYRTHPSAEPPVQKSVLMYNPINGNTYFGPT